MVSKLFLLAPTLYNRREGTKGLISHQCQEERRLDSNKGIVVDTLDKKTYLGNEVDDYRFEDIN